MITSLCKKCLYIFLICLGLYKKKTISHGLFSYRPYKWRQCSKIFIETSEMVSGSTWVLNISTSFPCSIRKDHEKLLSIWWKPLLNDEYQILKQVCNSGQSNPTQPFYPFVSTPHGQGNPECIFHQEAVLVTRRAERCGVVYPVEMWPACSTGFPIRPLRSAGARHLRFVRPMKSLTPAILVSIMARSSFKSKLIFFVASTHPGPFR